MNKKQKLAMWVGAFFLIPLLVVLLFSGANYFSAKRHERLTISKASHNEINSRSLQERTEYFKMQSEIESLRALHVKANQALGWIAVTGVLICFVAGFVALAIFLAGVPRVI